MKNKPVLIQVIGDNGPISTLGRNTNSNYRVSAASQVPLPISSMPYRGEQRYPSHSSGSGRGILREPRLRFMDQTDHSSGTRSSETSATITTTTTSDDGFGDMRYDSLNCYISMFQGCMVELNKSRHDLETC